MTGAHRFRALALLPLVFAAPAFSQSPIPPASHWYATTAAHLANGTSLTLGSVPVTLDLRSGWSCSIRLGTAADSRLVRCVKASDALEFSVQCDVARPRDHVQVRLRNDQRDDFIEVGCSPA